MGILKSVGNLFGSEKGKASAISWKNIRTEQDLEAIIANSSDKPVVLYKHSTRCAVSYFALNNLESMEAEDAEKADFYMVDVISRRPLSQFIAAQLDIEHQSPQVIVLKNGEPVWSGSHNQVKAGTVLQHIS